MADRKMTSTAYTQWLEGIIDSINDGVLVIDQEGIVQMINTEYTRITGVKEKKIVGQPLREVRTGAVLPKTLTDGKHRSGIFRKEGSSEYIVDMAPIHIEGDIVGAVSICKSLNEVHYLNKELNRSKEKIKALKNTVGSIYRAKYTFDDILGKEGGLKKTYERAKKAAHSNLNILIQGESGTGKELFAHAIHHESPRAEFPFIPVNCAAIPASLLESELFGYEEGSFTNSKKGGKMGLFELAHQGTLFLDEIGDLPYELQAKLLRVLQDGRIRKVGSLKEREIDVQVISATNKNLEAVVQKQRFREDLFYRLNGVRLALPPLRHRKDDINAIIKDVLRRNNLPQYAITGEAEQLLVSYHWPGNTRELFNVIQYAISMCDSDRISKEDLPDSVTEQRALTNNHSDKSLKKILKDTEQDVIEQTMNIYGHTLEGKKQTAQHLGISLATLYNKISASGDSKN